MPETDRAPSGQGNGGDGEDGPRNDRRQAPAVGPGAGLGESNWLRDSDLTVVLTVADGGMPRIALVRSLTERPRDASTARVT